jgi:actin-related protein 10
LDIGSSYTRIGLSGESTPRFIIPSVVHLQQENKYVRISDVSLSDATYLRRVLRGFIRDIYMKYLLLHPKDHRVIVLEDLASPSVFRNTLASLLFEEFKVPYGTFVPYHLMCLFAIGRQSLMVVRVGYSETTVLPIYEGIPIVSAWQQSSVGAQHFHRAVAESLIKNGSLKSRACQDSENTQPITKEALANDLENIAVRTCFVRPRGREDLPPSTTYSLTGGELVLTVDGRTRAFSGDAFFASESNSSIAVLILESLKKCAIDCRKELAENIVVVGGVVATPGFMSRLKEELMAWLEDDFLNYSDVLKMKDFKFHKLPVQPNCVEWMGGRCYTPTHCSACTVCGPCVCTCACECTVL